MADYSCTIYRKSRSWEKATWPEISNSRSMKTFLTGVMQKVYSDWEISPGFQKGAVQKLFFAVKPIGREKGWWHVAKHKIRHQQRTTEPDPHRRWRQQLPGQRAWTSSPRLCWYGSGDSEIYSKDSVLRRGVFWINLLLFTRIGNYCWPSQSRRWEFSHSKFTSIYFSCPSPRFEPTQSIGSCLTSSSGNQIQLSFQVKTQPGLGWS